MLSVSWAAGRALDSALEGWTTPAGTTARDPALGLGSQTRDSPGRWLPCVMGKTLALSERLLVSDGGHWMAPRPPFSTFPFLCQLKIKNPITQNYRSPVNYKDRSLLLNYSCLLWTHDCTRKSLPNKLFTQQIFTEDLLCARQWGTGGGVTTQTQSLRLCNSADAPFKVGRSVIFVPHTEPAWYPVGA